MKTVSCLAALGLLLFASVQASPAGAGIALGQHSAAGAADAVAPLRRLLQNGGKPAEYDPETDTFYPVIVQYLSEALPNGVPATLRDDLRPFLQGVRDKAASLRAEYFPLFQAVVPEGLPSDKVNTLAQDPAFQAAARPVAGRLNEQLAPLADETSQAFYSLLSKYAPDAFPDTPAARDAFRGPFADNFKVGFVGALVVSAAISKQQGAGAPAAEPETAALVEVPVAVPATTAAATGSPAGEGNPFLEEKKPTGNRRLLAEAAAAPAPEAAKPLDKSISDAITGGMSEAADTVEGGVKKAKDAVVGAANGVAGGIKSIFG